MNLRLNNINIVNFLFYLLPKNIKSVSKGRADYHKGAYLDEAGKNINKRLGYKTSVWGMKALTRDQLFLSVIKACKDVLGIKHKI